jgi:hypothetical protein
VLVRHSSPSLPCQSLPLPPLRLLFFSPAFVFPGSVHNTARRRLRLELRSSSRPAWMTPDLPAVRHNCRPGPGPYITAPRIHLPPSPPVNLDRLSSEFGPDDLMLLFLLCEPCCV